MATVVRWSLALAIFAIVVVAPVVYFRELYGHAKRLRVVVPGRVYRGGQLTAPGFEDAIRTYGLRTIVNVQDEYPDPDLDVSIWGSQTVKERALCERLGVRYVHLKPETIPRRLIPDYRPPSIEDFLAVMDNPDNYPVLIHCHAGLHRTGVLTAIYHMEYQGWTPEEAWRDMRAHGFGPWVATADNDYVKQFVLTYQRGIRNPDRGAATPFRVPHSPSRALVVP